ncbi:hypothetical protein [Methanobacterium sp. ACI-7]|uniref:hypothetical protein n=1 Tax=unclassified Methanobacterium TaxID=2627676 RepID=UPI0039C0868B
MILLDALSSLGDAIANFINTLTTAILAVGVGIIYGIIIAIIMGFVILGIVKARNRFK